MSQATANAYINYGAAAALSVGQTWGCTSTGRFINAAINTFAANVNATKTTVNRQIANVKANKQYQYQQYLAYLAWLAYQAYLVEQQRMAEEQVALQPRSGESYTGYLRRINNVPSSYSSNYVLTNYGSSQGQNRFYGQSSSESISNIYANTGTQLIGRATSSFLTSKLASTIAGNMSSAIQQAFPAARGSVLAAETVGGKTYGIAADNMVSRTAKIVSRGAPVIGGLIDFGVQIAQGESVMDAGVKAIAHTGIGIGAGVTGAQIGAAIGTIIPVPVVGTVLGAAIGFGIGVAVSRGFDMAYDWLTGK